MAAATRYRYVPSTSLTEAAGVPDENVGEKVRTFGESTGHIGRESDADSKTNAALPCHKHRRRPRTNQHRSRYSLKCGGQKAATDHSSTTADMVVVVVSLRGTRGRGHSSPPRWVVVPLPPLKLILQKKSRLIASNLSQKNGLQCCYSSSNTSIVPGSVLDYTDR